MTALPEISEIFTVKNKRIGSLTETFPQAVG